MTITLNVWGQLSLDRGLNQQPLDYKSDTLLIELIGSLRIQSKCFAYN